ncbi:hypothetical protein Q7P37_009759 [Cladosporium fusiforme]
MMSIKNRFSYPESQHHPHPHPPPPPPHAAPVQQHPPPPHQQQQQPPPPPSQQQQQQQQHAYGAPPLPSGTGTLPPIQQQPYPPPGAAPQEQPNHLAPLRHHPHDAREAPEYHQYNQHNHSGHATPAPVNRSFSVDSHPQRTPTTPAQPAPYPPATAPDAAHQHMEHHSYPPTNGVAHGMPHSSQGPPPQGPPPQHDPHSQYAMTPVMENHNGYGPPPPPMYPQPPGYGPATSINFNVQRKKQMRATQACEQCRQRKQKCDEGNPCSFCKESKLTCQYRDTPPAKTDKNMDKVLSYLEQITSSIPDMSADISAKIANFDERLRRMEQQRIKPSPAVQEQPPDEEEPTPKRKQELDDHRTAPHKLILLWPNVRPLLQEANVDVNDGYVMEAEDRGVLRLYGRGEGIEEQDGTQPGGPASPARSEDSMSNDAPSPPEGVWGCGLPAYAYPNAETRSHPYTAGGLKPDGTLDLDAATIDSLWESYVKHIHPMHPFLDKGRTRKLIQKFITRYSPNRKVHNAFAVAESNESDRPIKRQRSNGPGGYAGISGDVVTKRFVDTERSPSNAVIYLILALGKICAHKDPLPGPVQDRALNANQVLAHNLSGNSGMTGSSPMSSNVKPSPCSPKLTPNANTHTPPAYLNDGMPQYRSRRSSFDGSPTSDMAKNMDVIPGIAYYAKAAEILGDQGDGNDLIHAQMFLLAGLYKGQLARVKESMSWITMAGRVIQTLLDRYKLYNDNYWTAYGDVRRQHEKGQKLITDMRQNLIVLASWTCLQLESDILAELRLPSSGIQNIENLLLMPHNLPEEETYESHVGLTPNKERKGESYNDVIMFYTAQMFLRKRLNQVHRQLYGPDCLDQPLSSVQALIKGHESILDGWRALLPQVLNWQDNDDPPQGILSARLRAKYWGARYVISRPFLDYALHIMPYVKDGSSVEEVALDVHRNPRDKADVHLFKAIELMGEGEVWAACRRCIEAAMQSTVALDGVPDRLIVTNIHGTAHAQFGNMLVLSVTWRTEYMRKLIDPERFQRLLKRTIRFLRRLSPISPTCQLDCSILEKIQRVLFGIPPDIKPTYDSEIQST